jgi:hypothetical protein
MSKVKFQGIKGNFTENGELIPQDNGLVNAIYSFNAVIPKGEHRKGDKNVRTVYRDIDVKVTMSTQVDPDTPHNDWLISAQSFADLWCNANKRHERLIFESQLDKVGVTFMTVGDRYIPAASSLIELHKPMDYLGDGG